MSENEGKPYKNKTHAIELALEHLGWGAKPAEIRDYLIKTFDLTMGKEHIGVSKGNVLKRRGKAPTGAKRGRPRKVKQPVAARAPRAEEAAPSNGTLELDDVLSISKLIEQFDSEAILQVAGLVTRIGDQRFRTLIGAMKR